MYQLTEEQKIQLADIRRRRREVNRTAFDASRKRMRDIKQVRNALTQSEEPMTVPELAAATGLESTHVLWCVTAMKKYGIVGERAQDDGYFRYGLEENPMPDDDEEEPAGS